MIAIGSPGAQAAPALSTGNDDPAAKVQAGLQQRLDAEGSADFWVRFADRADLSQASQVDDWVARGEAVASELRATAEGSQAAVVDLLEDPVQRQVRFQRFWATNAIYVFDGPAGLASQLAAFAEVEGLYAPVGYELVQPTPGQQQRRIDAVEWGIANVNADDVWDQFGARGEGITVASIDTGTQFDHPALVGQYRGNNGDGSFDHNYNWFDAAGNCPDAPCDLNGHGTHTMGTMAGDDGAENQIGMAPLANWITANGCCPSDPALISSGQWMLEPTDLAGQNPDASMRPHVVNNSWGTRVPSNDPFMEDVLTAWAASGIFGVWSNGNNGPGCATSGSPGSRIINYSVGAYDINNNIAGFSSRGPGQDGQIKPNISAPGVDVRSSVPTDGYTTIDGTSMAAPHVAGAIALLWSAAPSLVGQIDATAALLDDTATDVEDLQCGGSADDNNVWGEGRLDALALLQAAPIGDTGTLTGVVSDAGSGDPIDGATVHITGAGVDRSLTTGPDGGYSTALVPGTYTVQASAFGFDPQTADVSIELGQTTVRDFDLAAAAAVSISGLVRDGSGHGWPMYAKITVEDAEGVNTFTNPFTGRYRLQLPANATYTLTIESQFPGYPNQTETIQVGDTNLVHDLQMTVSVDQCRSAPGYELDQPAIAMVTTDPGGQFADYFDSRGITVDFFSASALEQVTGYDVVLWGYQSATSVDEAEFLAFLDRTDTEGSGVVFLDHAFTTGNGIKSLSTHTGNPASVTTSTGGSGQQNLYEVVQEHPILDGFSVGDQIVHEPDLTAWVAWFDGYQGQGRQVIANLGRTGDGILGSGIGVQERPNNRHVLMSIHSSSATRGPSDWSSASDQIFWNAVEWATPGSASFECVPVAGGLVAGNVLDRNTREGVNGATVASVDRPEESTVTFATPDDPGVRDGFYWMFSSVTGRHRFTASAGSYTSVTRPVEVEADWTSRRSFQLAAGRLDVSPGGVQADVPLGGSAQRTFTVTNTGTAPARLELSERDGGFTILRADGTSVSGEQIAASPGAPVRQVPLRAPLSELVGDATLTGAGIGAQASTPAPGAEPWTDLTNFPQTVFDNNVVEVDGKVYSFGGIVAGAPSTAVFVFDPAAQSWTQLGDMPGASRMQAAEGVIDGKVYLVSGWSGLDTTTMIYDPASDSWDTGAQAPFGRAAAGSAVLDGQLYVVGGCTTGSCAPEADDVFRYDPATDSWETLADYPAPTSWLSCAGVGDGVYCAGGLTASGAPTSTWRYDPDANTWTPRADMPFNLWGSGYIGANGQFLISGGITGDGTNITNQGLAYNPDADTWTNLPASNSVLFRPGSACGFYKVGGSDFDPFIGFIPDDHVEVLPGLDTCGLAPDVPWLTVDPTTATLAPGDSLQVSVNLDAQVAQPGAYTATIPISEDTPYTVPAIDVTMNVQPPATWGKITGTVTGITCEGESTPLAEATVHLSTWVMEHSLFTDQDGGYAHWLDFRHSPFFMIVAKDGYQPQFRQTTVNPGETTTENWTLNAQCTTGTEQPDQHIQ